MEEIIRNFKNKISKQAVIGPFCKTIDPALIECIGYSGFDFAIVDMEHGPISLESSQNLIRAAQLTNLIPFVRIKENSFSLIGSVLDIGAGGVIIPHINTVEDLKIVLEKSKFYPDGQRGVCRYVRAAKYSSKSKEEYFSSSNDSLIIIQIEGIQGINNINDIIDFGGFDILFIGTYDLSQSLGVIGQVDHPIVIEKINEVVKNCRSNNILVGSFADTVEDAKKLIEIGIKFISISVDMGIFFRACMNITKSL
jgi:4-hydroxy-2-oxoheptanedioate aldolase